MCITACVHLIGLHFIHVQAQTIAGAPTGLATPVLTDIANETYYVIDATCSGTGRFSGQGTLDGDSGVFEASGATFEGTAAVNSTGGIYNGILHDHPALRA